MSEKNAVLPKCQSKSSFGAKSLFNLVGGFVWDSRERATPHNGPPAHGWHAISQNFLNGRTEGCRRGHFDFPGVKKPKRPSFFRNLVTWILQNHPKSQDGLYCQRRLQRCSFSTHTTKLVHFPSQLWAIIPSNYPATGWPSTQTQFISSTRSKCISEGVSGNILEILDLAQISL